MNHRKTCPTCGSLVSADVLDPNVAALVRCDDCNVTWPATSCRRHCNDVTGRPMKRPCHRTFGGLVAYRKHFVRVEGARRGRCGTDDDLQAHGLHPDDNGVWRQSDPRMRGARRA